MYKKKNTIEKSQVFRETLPFIQKKEDTVTFLTDT